MNDDSMLDGFSVVFDTLRHSQWQDVMKLKTVVPTYLTEPLTEEDYSLVHMVYGWNSDKVDKLIELSKKYDYYLL